VWCVPVDITGGLWRDSRTFQGQMPETLGESTPPSPTAGAGAQKRKAKQTPEADAAQQRSRRRARARQSRESYKLIWLMQQRLRAVS